MDDSSGSGSHGDGGAGEQRSLKHAAAKDKDYQVRLGGVPDIHVQLQIGKAPFITYWTC